jgi:hypothetical protein
MHKLMEAYIKTVLLPAGRGRVGIKAAPIVSSGLVEVCPSITRCVVTSSAQKKKNPSLEGAHRTECVYVLTVVRICTCV